MYEINLIVRDDKRFPNGRELHYCTKFYQKMINIVREHQKRGSKIEVVYPNGKIDVFAC